MMRIRLFALLFAGWLPLLSGGCKKPAVSTQPSAAAEPVSIRFRDIAAEAGLSYQFTPGAEPPLNILKVTTGAGVAFLDYDNDGWQDVLCVSLPRPGLFHNEGGRGFKDVTARSGLAREDARWNGCATGDYDNDGRVDLFLTACDRTALFHNNGDGTFKDVTAAAGVQLRRWATSAAFADVDQDGLLDLYVGCYVHFAPGMPEWMTIRGVHLPLSPMAYEAQKGAFFRNLGNGRFREATREAGLDATAGKTLGVLFADADNDGDDDLYLANDEEPQDFFVNDGRGHFRNLALENGTAFNGEGGRQGGMGVDFGDYDGDGRLDLFVGTFSDELKSLYHATPSGVYEQAATTARIAQSTRPWVTFGTKFVDFDNDGRLDLMMINGHVRDLVQKVDPANSYPQKSQLFLNAGAGRFREVSDAVGPDFRKPIVGRGLAVGDFDNDGDIDALTADLQGRPQLLQNDGGSTAGNWLTVELTGKRRNRMAIGARVTLVAGGVRQVREVRTDGSILAAHDPRVHFGMGRQQQAEQLIIRWSPGKEQTLTNVKPNQVLRLREP